jgi:putative transposase
MRFRFVARERASFPVRGLCRLVGVAVSGFYAWLRRGPARREGVDQALRARVGAIFAASRGTYGSPRVHAELRAQGIRVGRSRVARLMREGGLAVTRRRRAPRTTDSRHGHPVAPNLLERRFSADRPDAAWLADIYLLPADRGGLALPGRRQGHGDPRDRRLEHGRQPQGRPRLRRAAHGHPAPSAAARPDPSLR